MERRDERLNRHTVNGEVAVKGCGFGATQHAANSRILSSLDTERADAPGELRLVLRGVHDLSGVPNGSQTWPLNFSGVSEFDCPGVRRFQRRGKLIVD